MFTEIKYERMPDGKRLSDYRGLSSDTKPTDNVSNGSTFYEMDTGFTSYYDGENEEWTEASA